MDDWGGRIMNYELRIMNLVTVQCRGGGVIGRTGHSVITGNHRDDISIDRRTKKA